MGQGGLHEHRRLARIGHVDGRHVLGRRLVGDPQHAPLVARELDGQPLAAVAEPVERMLREQPHVARSGRAHASRGSSRMKRPLRSSASVCSISSGCSSRTAPSARSARAAAARRPAGSGLLPDRRRPRPGHPRRRRRAPARWPGPGRGTEADLALIDVREHRVAQRNRLPERRAGRQRHVHELRRDSQPLDGAHERGRRRSRRRPSGSARPCRPRSRPAGRRSARDTSAGSSCRAPAGSATAAARRCLRDAPAASPRAGCRCRSSSTGCRRSRSSRGGPANRRGRSGRGGRASRSRCPGAGGRGNRPGSRRASSIRSGRAGETDRGGRDCACQGCAAGARPPPRRPAPA